MALVCLAAQRAGPPPAVPELGCVRWSQSLDEARAESKQAVRPIALLFQRSPAAHSARVFGETALSHPLIVELLETEFIPVRAIKNDPIDSSVLVQYGEPATGGPVLRFLDSHGNDIVPRRDDVADTHGLAERLAEVFAALGRSVPGYVQVVAEETAPGAREHAWIDVPDLSQSAPQLAAIPGVVGTGTGKLAGREVLQVTYRPARLSFRELLEQVAQEVRVDLVYAGDQAQLETARRLMRGRVRRLQSAPEPVAEPSSDKGYLRRSHLRYLPLTPLQALRINADLANSRGASRWLSPRQLRLAVLLAQARSSHPEVLTGLDPPSSLDDLGAYEIEIGRLLEGAEASVQR